MINNTCHDSNPEAMPDCSKSEVIVSSAQFNDVEDATQHSAHDQRGPNANGELLVKLFDDGRLLGATNDVDRLVVARILATHVDRCRHWLLLLHVCKISRKPVLTYSV